MNNTVYYGKTDTTEGNIKVVFFNANGVKLEKGFDSDYLADKFVKKLRYSKCTFVSRTDYR